MHKQLPSGDEAANHQLPIVAAFWIIWIVPMEECSSLMQNLRQIHCSTRSVILNVMATQSTCSDICCPHWLAQWSCHCSCMQIAVHSPWLAGQINVAQTVLIILTMVGLFPGRLCISAFFLLLLKNSCLHFPPTTPPHTRIGGWCISAFGGQKVSVSNFESTVYIPSVTLIVNEKEKK